MLAHDMRERDEWLMEAISHLSEIEQQLLPIAAKIMNRLAEFEHPENQHPRSQGATESQPWL